MNQQQQDLVDHCFELAQEMLALNGEFHPMGAYIGSTGRVQMLGVEIDPKKIEPNGVMIDKLNQLAAKEKLSRYVLCYEVTIQLTADSSPTDAICVQLSEEGTPQFYQPFQKTEEEIHFDTIFGVAP